jgi:hypothetical protein
MIRKFRDFNDVSESLGNEDKTITTGHLVNYLKRNYPIDTPIFIYDTRGSETLVKITDSTRLFEEQDVYRYEDNDHIFFAMRELDPDGHGYDVGHGRRYTPPKPTIIKALVHTL